MENPIFISYKRVDKERVFEVKEFIEARTGLSCWIDLDGIESDAVFKNIIIRAINACEVMLFMYSNAHSQINNFEKDWTMKELTFASKKNKRIVFVNIDGSELTDVFEFDYGSKQQVDALDKSRLEKLAKDLKKWIPTHRIEENSEGLGFAGKNDKEKGKYWSGLSKLPEGESLLVKTLPKSLRFEYQDKKFYMVLSEDEKFYLGNLNAKEDDMSWWKNKWIQTLGVGAICTGAVVFSFVPLTIAIIVGLKALTSIISDDSNTSSNYIKIDTDFCNKLSEVIGYHFSIPSNTELKGVKMEMREGCVVLRVSDNPKLLSINPD